MIVPPFKSEPVFPDTYKVGHKRLNRKGPSKLYNNIYLPLTVTPKITETLIKYYKDINFAERKLLNHYTINIHNLCEDVSTCHGRV